MKILYAILAIYWIVISILVFSGIVELSTFSVACACLLAGLGFINLLYDE